MPGRKCDCAVLHEHAVSAATVMETRRTDLTKTDGVSLWETQERAAAGVGREVQRRANPVLQSRNAVGDS